MVYLLFFSTSEDIKNKLFDFRQQSYRFVSSLLSSLVRYPGEEINASKKAC
jgi:hypothetical protein